MKTIIKQNILFYTIFIVLFISVSAILFTWSKVDIHLFINNLHSDFADLFFKYITNFGDGLVFIILAVVLFFINKRYSYIMLSANLLASLVAQIIKRTAKEPRPVRYFSENFQDIKLHLVDGVKILMNNSLPSGHTTTAFAVATVLSLILPKKHKILSVIFIILASLVAYSRMYLSLHFLVDVYTGALIGTLSGTVMYYFLTTKKHTNK